MHGGWGEFSIDRSIQSFDKQEEGGKIYSSFWDEMRRFYWMVVRRRGDGCLISKKFLTRARLTESQENLHSLSYSKAVQFRGYKAIKERK